MEGRGGLRGAGAWTPANRASRASLRGCLRDSGLWGAMRAELRRQPPQLLRLSLLSRDSARCGKAKARSAVLIAVAIAGAYDCLPPRPLQQIRGHPVRGPSAVSSAHNLIVRQLI